MNKKVYIGELPLDDSHVSILRSALDNEIDRRNSNLRKSDKSLRYIPKDRVNDVIVTFSKKSAFHPFKEFVELKIWDGIDRLKLICESLIVSDDFKKYDNFYKSAVRKFFIGIVARVYKPGAKNIVLVLQGHQGIGKSRWCDTLLPVKGAYAEGAIDPERPDNLAYHTEKLLWHIAEFDAVTGKKDVAALKNYVDMSEVTFRRPYDKFATTAPSHISFIASVNTVDFLKDPTGSRRFLILPLLKINPEHGIDMQQVYAQAKHLMDTGIINYLTKDEEKIQAEINSSFGADTISELITQNILPGNDTDWLSVAELVEQAAKILDMPGIRQASKTDVRNKIERMGFKTRQLGSHSAKEFNIKLKGGI